MKVYYENKQIEHPVAITVLENRVIINRLGK